MMENLRTDSKQETRVVLVIGATSGIGFRTAVELARRHAHVLVHGRTATHFSIARCAGSNAHQLLARLPWFRVLVVRRRRGKAVSGSGSRRPRGSGGGALAGVCFAHRRVRRSSCEGLFGLVHASIEAAKLLPRELAASRESESQNQSASSECRTSGHSMEDRRLSPNGGSHRRRPALLPRVTGDHSLSGMYREASPTLVSALDLRLSPHGFAIVEPDETSRSLGIVRGYHRKTWNTNRAVFLARPASEGAQGLRTYVETLRHESGRVFGSSWWSQLGLQLVFEVEGAPPSEADLARSRGHVQHARHPDSEPICNRAQHARSHLRTNLGPNDYRQVPGRHSVGVRRRRCKKAQLTTTIKRRNLDLFPRREANRALVVRERLEPYVTGP